MRAALDAPTPPQQEFRRVFARGHPAATPSEAVAACARRFLPPPPHNTPSGGFRHADTLLSRRLLWLSR